MIQVKVFTFNAFSENTYVVYDETKAAFIIDPGCSDGNERKMLESFIRKEDLSPIAVVNTHCHIDHVLGNAWSTEAFSIPLWIPKGEETMLARLPDVAAMYGVSATPSPAPDRLLVEDEILEMGHSSWSLISAPGHSPASICLFDTVGNNLIAGDVIFYESIGRTDLPGGNHKLLIQNIQQKLFNLPEITVVYPGHGPSTTIGHEKIHNPFL
jgi:glyoxylase-like metal-dependent hydrolase (beta-lactamase superfamily II)